MKEPYKSLPVVGWRELVALPELGLAAIPAKIDTGARTSSLHGTILERFERDGCVVVPAFTDRAQTAAMMARSEEAGFGGGSLCREQ